MSKEIQLSRPNKRKFLKKWTDDRRPEWQQGRGARYGNNRKFMALMKIKKRRSERQKNNNIIDD